MTPECVRNLSGALALEGVTLSEASVQACEAAMAAAHQGCGWVGPTKVPVPPECRGLLEGTAKAGAPCRSSLECPSGLFCRGGGPTQAGVCSPPGEPGRPCHQSVDALAVHTRQHHDAERNHPECQGYCSRKRCVPVTETCKANVQCGRDKHCVEGRCVDGPYAKAGAPCADTGCEPGSHCVDHVCTPLRPEGEACTRDDQCLGACLKPEGATEGTCGMRCFASFTP